MKTKRLLQGLTLLVPVGILTGCVGYNTALFMTKSNAGLDFDTKPPTAEINISRKEGVLEPVFEGGKAPPVLASFSSEARTGGGVGRFFFGVDQTFAGGDAALTMAKLYDQTNAVPEVATNLARFNSGFSLSQPPSANTNKGWFGLRKRLFGLAGPGEVRPLYFGTDSQLGVKVAWNGVGGPYPDTIKIGYNRKEMAVAPVTFTPSETLESATGTATASNVVRMPSFLATVDTSVSGSSNVGVGWMQYFATGDSASFMARQYGVREAMLRRSDPMAAAISEAEAQKAGGIQAEKDQAEIDKIVDFAFPNGTANMDNIKKLIPGTSLKPEEISSLTPNAFRGKMRASWSAKVPTFLINKPK